MGPRCDAGIAVAQRLALEVAAVLAREQSMKDCIGYGRVAQPCVPVPYVGQGNYRAVNRVGDGGQGRNRTTDTRIFKTLLDHFLTCSSKTRCWEKLRCATRFNTCLTVKKTGKCVTKYFCIACHVFTVYLRADNHRGGFTRHFAAPCTDL